MASKFIKLVILAGITGLAGFLSGGCSSPEVKRNPTADEIFEKSFDLRIENEDKLVVPEELKEEVWNYMVERLVDDKSFIKSLDPALDSYWMDEYFSDIYFDTPELDMLNRQSGIRSRKRINFTDPTNKKSGRQLVQVKINDIDDNMRNRGEIKFEVEFPPRGNSADDKHPVLGMIVPSERDEFKRLMAEIDIDPYSLKKVLVNEQRRRSLYITRSGGQFISIRLDECSSEKLWVKWSHVELEPELNETPYTAADSAGRAYMENTNQAIIDDIMAKFPAVKQDLTPKYNKAFGYFEKKIPFFRTLFKYGII